ncbi:MAG: hypothetical protein KC464_31480, partial [Myxococcales bacterium]|nr:hypothetical protein [Myxococcales bacterium]
MNGVMHLLIGSIGAAFATLILRADPKRWDNRAFALLGYLDAMMALYRGVAASSGADIADRVVMLPCATASPLLAWASIEFAYSFPFSRRLPWRWRVPLVVASVAAMLAMAAWIDQRDRMAIINLGFFTPAMLVMIVLLIRNLRRVPGDRFGVRLVALALMLRWITANVVYGVYGSVDHDTWALLLWLESTIVVLLAFVLIGLATIRSNLFTMRSAMGALMLDTVFMLTGLLLTAAAIDGAMRAADLWPRVERPLLMTAALVPLLVFMAAERLRPRLLQAGFDPRAGLRREILERALRPASEHGDPDKTIAMAIRALREISGGDVEMVRDPDAAITAQVRAGGFLVTPVGHGDKLCGSLVVHGGVLDRETAHAASVLAEQICIAFEYRRLLGELDESRRLAALGAFAAGIAHDIRTPLTSVQMNVQILRGKVSLPPDDMEYFDIALAELRRLEGHVKELLDYAKPLALHKETVAVRDLVDDAARTIEPILAERGQVLRLHHGDGVPPVAVDRRRLEQVLWNLLDNAGKASADGTTIELRTRDDAGRVAIDVVDTGGGIAPGDLDHIFEPFFTTRPDGTGLGLALCQKVVRAHDGEVQVESAVAAGSRFTVVLPAASG